MTFEQILEAERRGELSFQQQAALDELRRRGVIPEATPVEAVAAPQQRTGVLAAVGRGAESLVGTSTTGIQAITGDANEAAELALKRAAASPFAEQVSWDKVKEVYGTQGALAAAMEVARQVPLAIAEQLPQLAASAGATAAGAKLGALTSPVTGPFGPIIGGGLGFAASSFPGLLGGNIERQAAEQQATGRPIDIDVGAAARGAAGQTVLEAAGTLIPLGRRAVGALFGPEVKALLDQGKKEAAEALARESLPVVLAKGTAVGVAAEVPTEILQSVIERGQAGLDILSDDALAEYGSTAYQTALLGPIGAAGRVADRSGARADIEAEKQAQAAREQKAQADKQRQEAQAEEQRRKSPDYILEVADKYESLAKQEDDLKAQIKRATKDAPLSREDADRNAVIQQQLKALKPQLDQARKDYIALGGPNAVKKAREQASPQREMFPVPERAAAPVAPVEEVETEDAKRARLTRDERNLAELLQQQRAAMADTTSVEQTLRAATQATQTSQQLAEVQKQLGELPKLPVLEEVEAEIQKRVKPLQKAVKAGDNEKVITLAQEILALEKQRDAARARQARMSPDQGLFAPEMVEAEAQRREALAGEIAQGRETAAYERRQGELEQEFSREKDARDAATRQALETEGELERDATIDYARSLLEQFGQRRNAEQRRARQTELFPEGREQVTQTSVEESETDLRNELNRLQQAKKELLKRGEAQEGLPYAAAEGPFTQLLDIEVGRGYVADRVKALDARIAEVKDLLLTDKVQLQDKIAELEKRRAEKQALPQEELAGALSREPGQIVDIDRRLAALRERLDTLQAGAMERRTVTVPADAEPTSQPVEAGKGPSWIPSRPSTRPAAQGPQVSTRPKEPLQAQIAALAERVLAAPNVDEDTKDVVRQMQDDLPAFLRTATRQTVQGAREQRARATGRAPSAAAETMAPQDVASWLYRTLTSGRADAATTAKARDVLRTLEEAKRSETETLPSGEIRRVAQQEFPEMPEPRATAFSTYEEFENYLATAAPMTADATGSVVMSVARLQRRLAPIREQAAALRAQEADLKQQAEALKAKTGAERAAAQARLDEAKFTLALTRNALESSIERMLTARSLAQQKYSDALTENIRVLMDISEGAKQFEAEIAAREPVQASRLQERRDALEARRGEQQNKLSETTDAAEKAEIEKDLKRIERNLARLPKGFIFDRAVILRGDVPGYTAVRNAEKKVEKALDEWMEAQTNLRDTVQRNIGADWGDNAPALLDYITAKKKDTAAAQMLWDARDELRKAVKDRKQISPLSSDAFGDFLVKQAQLADQLEAAQKRVTGFSKALRFHADKADLDAFLKRRDRAQAALSKALFALPEGGDVGAVIRNHMKPLEDAKTALADKLGAYKGTREQIEAFDKAQADLKAAEELMAEVAVATRPDDAQAELLLAAAKTPAVQAGKLESVVQQRLLAARERAEARRRVAPTPPAATLSEREAADGDRRRAEQARLEAGEASGVQILFEKNKEDLLADTNYTALVEKSYNRSLPNAERMAAAQEADKYLQDKIASKEKKGEKRSAASALHEENLRGAKAKLADLRAKEGATKTEKQAAKLKDAIAAAQKKVDFHQDKLNKSLTGTRIERLTRGDLAKLRELVHEEVRSPTQERAEAEEAVTRTRVAGERLGVAEGTQQRAIGPATRPEVMAPKTLRTGSAESVAGETTTPSKNRIQEARGVRQRDVQMSKKEIAEANLTAAQMELAKAQTPADKRVAEIKVEIAEVGLEIATKGETNERGMRKAALENELGGAEDVRKKAKETAVAQKETAQLQEGVIVAAEAPADGSVWVPEITVKLGGDTYSKTGVETQVTLGKPAKIGTMSVATVLIRKDSTRFSDGKGSIVTVDNSELVYEHVEKNKYTVLKRTDKDAAKIEKWKKALGAPLVDAFFKNKGKKTQSAVTKAALGKDIEPQVTKVAEYFEDAYASDIELSAEDVNLSRGATANPSTVDSVRAELKKAFPDLGRVQIYDSVDALIKANPQYEGRIPNNARGFVDSAGNKAFLIAENIDQGRALGVLLHEVGAHIGLKNMLGDAQYNALVKAVETWAKKDDGSVESRVAKAAQARVEAAETPASQRRDETLAYAIEEAVNAGVKPMETKGPLGQWLGRIAQLFRRALEKFGLPPKALDAQGLVDMAFGAAKVEMRGAPPPRGGKPGEILFSKTTKYAPSLSEAGKVADKLIAPQRSFMGKLKANLLGFRVQVVDRLDPFVKAFERSVSAGLLSDLKATQAMYYLRMQGQQMHFTSQAISDGAPMLVEKQRKDGETEYVIEAKADGANIKKVVDILSRKEVAKEAGSPDAANRLLTLYMGAIRAENKGFDKLNFGRAAAERELVQLRNELKSETLKPNERARVTRRIEKLTANMDRLPSEQEIRAAKAAVEANPTLKKAFDEARDIYNAYNRDLISFAAETGTISKDEAARLLRDNDYIPYYRERGGVAELVIGSETPVRIGNLKDSPHLVELMGDQEPIFDFLTSSVQNTSMLIDMSMHNLAVKNAMWELASAGLARNYRVQTEKGKRRDIPEGAVRFRVKGEDWYSVVDTDTIGVPSELLVKGLAGIPTMFPAMVQILGMPARLLRRLIVASPIYAARQLFRDSLAASIASGANTVPVLSALKQIRRKSALDARGVAGGQVFTGMPEDMTRLLREMQSGRPGWAKAFSKLEAMSMEADAATRRAQYDSYIEQGLSEMEATYMALESMNFTKRGVSPTIHMLSTLIPFFNAQIQGLDVMYKSFTGKMPFNERLKVREKLIKRGLLMAGMSLAYAAAMQDEEEYKNATPDQKYGNWFVRMPFLDEMAGERVTVRVPIPFELGYIFKALPEALYNTMATEEGGEDAAKAFKQILINTIPGGSSYMMPAAVKPLIEVGLGKSFFTGRDLETAREQDVQPFARYREQTSEAAKAVGSMFNVSPIKLEALISGYTGSLGLALLQTLNFAVPDTGPESATKRLSQLSLVGTLFQPSDAQGIIDAAYARMNEVRQVQQTYEALLKESPERAAKYAQDKIDEMSLAAAEGNFRQQLGKLTTYERQVRAAPTLTAQEKRERLDQLRQAKIRVASQARALLDRRAPPASPA